MAGEYCIPPNLAQKLIAAAKEGDVVGNIAQLYEMTTEERRNAFSKHVGEETARQINSKFEQAMSSNQQKSLAHWAKNTFSTEAKKKGRLKSALEKIQDLQKQGLLTPENEDKFLADLVEKKLGVAITAKEAETLNDLATELEKLSTEVSEIGLPTAKWWEAKKKMDDFVLSQTPASRLRVLTSTIGRGMMLASVKSPVVNITSNTVQGVMTAFERRISRGQSKGLNNAFARAFVGKNMYIYQKSGYDTSRMISWAEDRKILGEEVTHSEGKGFIRATGRFVEDTVFKQLMGAPDVAFASWHFADSANLATTAIAKKEGLKGDTAKKRALEIFKDAVQIEPKTFEGEMVRSQAIADAQYATFTNKSVYSDSVLKLRGIANSWSKDLRIGDQNLPFVQAPANAVGAGVNSSGVFFPFEFAMAIKNSREGQIGAMRKLIPSFVRAGTGMALALAISSVFDPEDFIGNYPVSEKERKLLDLKKATPNSLKIGDKWISLDYFGAIAAPLVGMLYAKKYAHDPIENVIQYYKGVTLQATKIPGFQDFNDLIKDVNDFAKEKSMTGEELTTAGTNLVLNYIRARTVPAILNDIAKATDPFERDADITEDPLAKIKASIPGGSFRGSLPVKKTVFGDAIKSENAAFTILFGSRVKTAQESALIKELIRLDSAGQLPSITDVEKTSERVKALKTQIPEPQFKAATKYYQDLLKVKVTKAIDGRKYKKGDDEKKKKLIEEAKEKSLDKMLKKYKYKKPKK